METTSYTLLVNVRDAQDKSSWDRFCFLYAPMILAWARKQGFGETDAEDLCQEILTKLVTQLEMYEPEKGSFRAWLATVTRNAGRDFRKQKANKPLRLIDDEELVAQRPAESEFPEEDYRLELVRRVLRLIRPDFTPQTWAAFTGTRLNGRPPAEVAAELRVDVKIVYSAQYRVLQRIREVSAGLVDCDGQKINKFEQNSQG